MEQEQTMDELEALRLKAAAVSVVGEPSRLGMAKCVVYGGPLWGVRLTKALLKQAHAEVRLGYQLAEGRSGGCRTCAHDVVTKIRGTCAVHPMATNAHRTQRQEGESVQECLDRLLAVGGYDEWMAGTDFDLEGYPIGEFKPCPWWKGRA